MDIKGYSFEEDYLYDDEHNWLKIDGNIAVVGVTDFFQKTANEIVFIELPMVDRTVQKGQPYSSIESGKWVGRLKAPLTGEIIEVNSELDDFPYLLNDSPYEDGWVMRLQIDDNQELDELINLRDEQQLKRYIEYIEAEHKKIEEAKG